ncbi:MAG TPA: DNA polymerase I [Bacillota bacterium]
MNKLVLIDGYSLVHRAFFALPPLQTADGQPTHAVYGFLNMLLKLLDEERPTHAAVVFDAKGPTFRDEIYADYKAHRPETPDDLRSQFPLVREACEALRIPVLEREGYEADDVLGTLARRAAGDGWDVLIVTGDRDVLQLVGERVQALITRRGISDLRRWDVEAIRGEYGLEPVQLIDVKALMGDTSDNIPGVPGVGEKTAVRLVREFGDLESVLANTDRISGTKLRENLRQYAGIARQSRLLARIDTDVPLEVDWETCRRTEPDADRARALFTRLEFRSLLDRLGIPRDEVDAAAGPAEGPRIHRVTGSRDLEEALRALGAAAAAAVTYRLDGTEPRRAPLRYLAVAAGDDAWVVECGDDLPERSALEIVDLLLQRAAAGEARLVVHDLKPLLTRCLCSGLWQACPDVVTAGLPEPSFDASDGTPPQPSPADGEPPAVLDTAVAAYLLDASRSAYRVSDLARQFLGVEVPEPEDLASGARRGSSLLAEVDRDSLAAVAGRQSALVGRLADALHAQVVGQGLGLLLRRIEAPLTEVLAAMEHAGIVVDREALRAMGEEIRARLGELQEEIHRLAGTEFNINSTQQLGEVLFERLGLPAVKRTKTGYSTDAEVLEQLAADHPIAARVLEHRMLAKLMGTYVEGLDAAIEADGRIHTTFQQTVAATGRLASIAPNLQNIPIRDEPGRRLRLAFAAPPGRLLLACDYSQIELRVLAHMSEDERMLDAFRSGEDIHRRTAAEVFGVALEEVTGRQRGLAKAVNFGIVYGISDFGLARQLGIPRDEARDFIERYFARYAGVQRYLKGVVAEARERGYVRTLFGRVRYLPDIRSRIFHRRSFAERTAMNTPIQGTAADIIKAAMVGVHQRLRAEERRARLLLQVHDELILEVPEDELEPVAHMVCQVMAGAVRLRVPLVVDAKVGRDWYNMSALDLASRPEDPARRAGAPGDG